MNCYIILLVYECTSASFCLKFHFKKEISSPEHNKTFCLNVTELKEMKFNYKKLSIEFNLIKLFNIFMFVCMLVLK